MYVSPLSLSRCSRGPEENSLWALLQHAAVVVYFFQEQMPVLPVKKLCLHHGLPTLFEKMKPFYIYINNNNGFYIMVTLVHTRVFFLREDRGIGIFQAVYFLLHRFG